MRLLIGVTLLVGLGACSENNSADSAASSPDVAAETAPTVATDPSDWSGKWTGPEGLYVIIRSKDGSSVELEMQSDLDTFGTYAGSVAPEGISFERGGEALLLRPASGVETGLKYLSDKTNCLMVKSGEGYCRD